MLSPIVMNLIGQFSSNRSDNARCSSIGYFSGLFPFSTIVVI